MHKEEDIINMQNRNQQFSQTDFAQKWLCIQNKQKVILYHYLKTITVVFVWADKLKNNKTVFWNL